MGLTGKLQQRVTTSPPVQALTAEKGDARLVYLQRSNYKIEYFKKSEGNDYTKTLFQMP